MHRGWAELRAEVARTYLGIIAWIMEPLLFMGAFYSLFALGLRKGGDNYVSFLLVGLISWKWFSACVLQGATTIKGHSGLIQQVYIPKIYLPVSLVTTATFKFLVIFSVLSLVLAVWQQSISVAWLALPVVIVAQLALNFAVASLSAGLIPIIPDFKLLLEILIMMLFFMSGVFLNIDNFPPHIQHLFYLNPVAVLLREYRHILMDGRLPSYSSLGYVVLWAGGIYAAAATLLVKMDRRYPRML